jgi:hypothetical protein
MDYKSKMLSPKRSVAVVGLIGLSAALITGCKTSPPEWPQPAPVAIAPVVQTNKPVAPPQTVAAPDSTDTMEPNILAWDAVSKEYRAHTGETNAPFSFSLTNVSARPVVIYQTSTSCDCTVAKLPASPWTLASGASGKIDASIDLSDKVGIVTNSIIVYTSQGNRRLNVKAILPETK